MTYQDLYEKAIRLLDNSEITIGEYDEMIKPLKREICEWISCAEAIRGKERTMSFGILPIDDIISCGVSADKSADQNVADVPSGDLISRADAIEAVCGKCSTETRMECALSGYFCCDRRELEALPSADRPKVNSDSAEEQIAETCDRPKGEWIENDALGWKCSKCGIITNLESNFCPCCGADMRGEDDG